MSTLKILNDNLSELISTIKNLDLSKATPNISPPEIYKFYCTDQSKDISFYRQNFNTYLLKQNGIVAKSLIPNKNIVEILSSPQILNVFYFEVWGDVIEHRDPPGSHLGYESNDYNTVLLPIEIPSQNKTIFDTFYNKKSVTLEEGKFLSWDVRNVPHYWKFDYKKVEKFFKLLHIDYIA